MAGHNATSRWKADQYATHGRFVAEHGSVVLALLDPQRGERILDVGCGDGALTAQIMATGADVLGIDASPELVAAAVESGVSAVVGDAQEMAYNAEFDAVFSNAALHWMLSPGAVAARMHAALRPGGRLVAEFGGFGNVAAIRTALAAAMTAHGYADSDPGQYYPTAESYAAVLRSAGFVDVAAELVPRQTLLPGLMDDWLRTFRQGFLDAHHVPPDRQSGVIAQAVALLRPALYDPGTGRWYADYVRLRVSARRPDHG